MRIVRSAESVRCELHHVSLLLDVLGVHTHGCISVLFDVGHLEGHVTPVCSHRYVVILSLCVMIAAWSQSEIFRLSALWPSYAAGWKVERMGPIAAGFWVVAIIAHGARTG